ncbi:hypothetical protein R69749_07227 [Paraburkholderia domus]|uniref:Uncharacterized protein n=1 Tax=Paraburkholderia domus TaxID=2793075 RepID=A0A9N8R3N8_9BURK|nr:hypothetical protein R70006_07220 [Paraburkholderia domus]CAE6884260.1 hypothetical protein R69749_07227 [Paraburkholderia domus]CAE6960016.1 hypothetical protein R70199_07247 [Paraburkholderia domus]CAE6964948.1 hypothetical protein R70211_07265 [Paraburkholderia domus]
MNRSLCVRIYDLDTAYTINVREPWLCSIGVCTRHAAWISFVTTDALATAPRSLPPKGASKRFFEVEWTEAA